VIHRGDEQCHFVISLFTKVHGIDSPIITLSLNSFF
jgi:hypothetical protein